MRKIKDKQQDDRLKPNHINNYIKYKLSEHPYKKAALVKLDNWTISKKVRFNYILISQVALVGKNLHENVGDITDMGEEDPLEKGMATCLKNTREESGRLQSIGLQRVRHD